MSEASQKVVRASNRIIIGGSGPHFLSYNYGDFVSNGYKANGPEILRLKYKKSAPNFKRIRRRMHGPAMRAGMIDARVEVNFSAPRKVGKMTENILRLGEVFRFMGCV